MKQKMDIRPLRFISIFKAMFVTMVVVMAKTSQQLLPLLVLLLQLVLGELVVGGLLDANFSALQDLRSSCVRSYAIGKLFEGLRAGYVDSVTV